MMDETLEELDEKEYNIPSLLAPPTLESILYESDDGGISDEDRSNQLEAMYDAGDNSSVASSSCTDGKSCLFEKSRDSVIRHIVLRGISSQLSSAVDRVNVGLPMAMAASSVIAIGTSHGIVLIFDEKQTLKWYLECSSADEQYGAVSSLCLNYNCSRLLSGYAKGQMAMWDLHSGKLLRRIVDCFPLGTAVLHIQFTDDPTLALCSDSGGSVFELTFKRVMAIRGYDSKCVFSGSHGEVMAINVLNMANLKSHPLQDVCIVALATLSKVIVISLRPLMKVLFTHSLKGPSSSLPIICWQFVVIQVSPKDRVVDPVLAFGRGSTIFFFQITASPTDGIEFIPLQKLETVSNLMNFLWFNPRTLAVVDSLEHLHVIDVKTRDVVEICDLSDVQLVYGSSHFKGLSTGGNVSKAMALAGEQSCYQSVKCYHGQVLLLGTKSVHVVSLRAWNERIDLLLKKNKYPEALSLALSFYEDRAKAVLGLTHHKEKKKEILINKLLDVLQKYVEFTLSAIRELGAEEAIEGHLSHAIPHFTEYCIMLDKTDLLFEQYFDAFSTHDTGRKVFLQSLEPYILKDTLHLIPPTVLKCFVLHYEALGLFDTLEQCILHLNVETLDLHKVITLCRTHAMYDAFIYIFNKGMSDYRTPFEELVEILQKEMKDGSNCSDASIKLGNKLLVYTSFCLSGRAYPWGYIEDDKRDAVRTEILRCLTVLHTRNAIEVEPPYPYLRILLHFDVRELLNVLALAFDEPEFNTDAGNLQKQRLFDILWEIVLGEYTFTPSEIGPLFIFVARQMAKSNNSINFSRNVHKQVVEYLFSPDNEHLHAEHQRILLELLFAGCLSHILKNELLLIAEKAGFYQICEVILENNREYHKIISCYLKDNLRINEVFLYIKKSLKSAELTEHERVTFINEVKRNIKDIILIDHHKAAEMVVSCFPELLLDIIDSLQAHPKQIFHFLQGCYTIRDKNTTFLLEEVFMNPDHQKQYFQLMCEFEPESIERFLKTADILKLDAILEVAQHYELHDTVAYLMEQMGNVSGAFEILLKNLKNTIIELTNRIPPSDLLLHNDEIPFVMKNINDQLDAAVKFCQRNSCKVDDAQHEALWLSLLDSILLPLKQYYCHFSEAFHLAYKDLTYHLLNSMMGYISLTSVLQKVLQDPTYKSSKFGEVKDFLLAVLETYNYKKVLLSSTKNLINSDLHQTMLQKQRLLKHGFSSHCSTCDICNKELQSGFLDETIIAFRCGHKFHQQCWKLTDAFDKRWACSLCNK